MGHSFDEVVCEEPLTKLPATLKPLLGSNDPPTNIQTSQISAVELKLLSDLIDVQEQIYEHEETLEDLRALQAKQRRLLKTCKGIRSLVRSLPHELLSKIFIECIPKEGATVSLETSPREAPLVLCHVCSRWRGVALSTPQLWNRLITTIGPAPPKPSHSRTLIDLVLEWLDRGKTLPLTLRFASHLPYLAQDPGGQFAEEADIPYDLLCALTDRLQVLDLALGWTPRYLKLLPLESHSSQLQSLILRRTRFSQAESWFSWRRRKPLVKFQNAPHLRRVAMYYPIFGENVGNVSFPWKQLTHFIISERIPHAVLEDLLRSCVNLEQGVFHLTATVDSILSRQVKIVQQHLIDLTITMDTSFNPAMLRNFELPALRSFRLGPLIMMDEHWGERQLLYPHLSSLLRLSFQAAYKKHKTLSCDRIVELLQCAPNIERLDLCPGIYYPDLMKALTVNASSTLTLSKLCSLSVDLGAKPTGMEAYRELRRDKNPRRFSALALREMVESRWLPGAGAVTCLKELHIYLAKGDEDISSQIQDMLGYCMSGGFVVQEHSADVLRHWSNRLKGEEVSWPEGLSVLVSEYGY